MGRDSREVNIQSYRPFVADPRFGLACLGKVNMAYESDQDLMIHFYRFVVQ